MYVQEIGDILIFPKSDNSEKMVSYVRVEVLKAVTRKHAAFLDVTQCPLVKHIPTIEIEKTRFSVT
jgi:hypothetical protein